MRKSHPADGTLALLNVIARMQYGVQPSEAGTANLDAATRELLQQAFEADPAWSSQGRMRLDDPGTGDAGRIIVELYNDAAPKAVNNFLCLCTGERGAGKASKKPLHYKVREASPQSMACIAA